MIIDLLPKLNLVLDLCLLLWAQLLRHYLFHCVSLSTALIYHLINESKTSFTELFLNCKPFGSKLNISVWGEFGLITDSKSRNLLLITITLIVTRAYLIVKCWWYLIEKIVVHYYFPIYNKYFEITIYDCELNNYNWINKPVKYWDKNLK